MDKNQELRTNIVLEAQRAIDAVKGLADGLDRIAQLKFDNVKTGFDSLTKAFEAAQKMSSKVAKAQIKDEEEVQTHLQKRAEIMSNMMKEFSKQKTGLSVDVDMSALQKELVKTTRLVADMYDALGQTPKAKNLMTESLNLLTKLSNAGMKGIGLEAAKREYKDFERQIQENKNMRDELDRQVAAGIAEKRRQQMVKEGKDPLDDPVYAKSEAGKKARQAMKQQAKEEAEALAQARAEQRAKVMPALEESKAARKARENATALNEQKAKERAKQAEADKNALQKRLKEMEEADAKELAATAKKYAKQKKQREQALADTEKRQEKNKEEWMKVWGNLRDMDNNPHRNGLYKTTGSYTPEMNRRKRQEQEQSTLDSLYTDSAKKREKVLEKEAQFRKALAEATDKAELDRMKSQDVNAKRIAREKAEREQALANARLDNEKKVQAVEKQNEERRKKNMADAQSGFARYFAVSDRSNDFHDKIDFLKSSGKKVSESELFRLEKEIEKIRRKALDIGATDIASKLTKSMLSGLNVVTEAQKRAKSAEAEENKLLGDRLKVLQDIARLYQDIQKHRGADGQSYSKAGYENTLNRINNLRNRAIETGLTGDAQLLTPALLNGTNTKLGQFNARLSEAKDKAQQLYMQFRQTGKEADRLNFLKAKADLKELNNLAEDFDRAISKARRHELTIDNIAKRAREAANWQIGGRIENTILDFPVDVVSTASKYELAMAGIAQVLPKVEESQGAANAQFGKFADIAAKYGQSIDNALESAKSIGRMYGQGGGDHDKGADNTALLTAQAAKMATVDNFDMLEATKGLESALAQFNLQTEDTNLLMERSGKILDVWTKLAHNSGASAQDLVQGVNQAGASARQAGVSFEMLNSLIAVGVRSTAKSGNEIGTTLKSMFASIQSDKAIKAMKKFGIEVYRTGKNGQRELRPMKDVILDISRALEATPKDTKEVNDFLLAISGGKYQVSKISAILGNYKELLRTMKEADSSAGFTNQQLELQLNTISRKWDTLKANISQWFANSGADGLANDLKWILDTLNRIVKAVMDSDTHFYQWAKTGVKILIAWKALPALINMATRAVGRFAAASSMTGGSALAASVGSSLGSIKTSFDVAKYGELKKQLAQGAVSANLYANTMTKFSGAVGKASVAARAGSSAMALFSGALGAVGGVLRGLLALFGGPWGIALTALSLLSVAFIGTTNDAEELAQKKEELQRKTEELSNTTSLEIEKHEEAKKRAEELAEQYNALVDSLNEVQKADDGSTESAQRQNEIRKQMGAISDEIQQILHANAIEFDEDGKINQATIENLAAADREATLAKLNNAQAEITAAKDATDVSLEQAKKRLGQHQAELKSTSALSMAYRVLYNAITAVEAGWTGFLQIVKGSLDGGFLGTLSKKTFGEAITNSWIENLGQSIATHAQNVADRLKFGWSDNDNLWAKQNMIEAQRDIDKYQADSGSYSDSWNEIEALKQGMTYDKRTQKYYERKPIDPTEVDVNAGKNHPLSDSEIKEQDKANKKAQREKDKAERARRKAAREANKKRPYMYTDEESKAFSTAASHINSGFSSFGVDTATMQAIANALNEGNFKGVADPFHNGADNAWDSSYNFAEQLKERFRKGLSLETALDDIFDGWGITWDNVINENVAELKKRFNYKAREIYFADPTEKNKTAGGNDLARFDELMDDPQYGSNGRPLHNLTVGLNQCVTSALQATSLVSTWAAEMSNLHVDNVDDLYRRASNDSRVTVKDYSDEAAQTGDIVIYVDQSGERWHAGAIAGREADGSVVNYDDSTQAGYKFVRRSPHDLGPSRIPRYLIHDNSVINSAKPATRWDRGSDSLQGFSVSPFEQFQYDQEKDKKLYETTKTRLELEEKITGYTAEIGQKIEENERLRLMSAVRAKSVYEVIERAEKAKVSNGLDKYKSVADAAGGKENFFNLPDSKKQELAKLAKEKSFEQAVSTWISAQKAFVDATKNLDQLDYEHYKKNGFLNPAEEEDFNLQALDLQYEAESSGKIFQDPRVEEQYHRNRAEVYQHRLDRLAVEREKANDEAPKIKEQFRSELEAQRDVVSDKKAALANAKTPEEIAKATKELDEAQRKLDLQEETWRNVEAYGTEAQRKVAKETAETTAKLNKENMAANKMAVDLQKKIGNGMKTMFSDVLMEGSSFRDAWKNLWTDIGKFALDRLLEIQLSRWIPGLKLAGGGSVSPKANGGLVGFASGGYTDGLIQGAGTGTSDSILTYLAHRGQFIATSNGEYIIKKSSVDKLGVGFLDTLNNNPEAIGALNGLKRYANGGNLGESYAPSMSLKGINGYKTFNKSNMEKQMSFSTRKMETLLQGLRQDVQDGNKSDNSVAQPIILNTQADSASVMKAIAKNPRALQAIMGNNQRRGFR